VDLIRVAARITLAPGTADSAAAVALASWVPVRRDSPGPWVKSAGLWAPAVRLVDEPEDGDRTLVDDPVDVGDEPVAADARRPRQVLHQRQWRR
jgi:hypothetical protein